MLGSGSKGQHGGDQQIVDYFNGNYHNRPVPDTSDIPAGEVTTPEAAEYYNRIITDGFLADEWLAPQGKHLVYDDDTGYRVISDEEYQHW